MVGDLWASANLFLNYIFRKGGIKPIAVNAPIKFNIAKKTIMNPLVLKNNDDLKLFANLTDAKLIKASIGKVPKAKINIVKAPFIKLPVVNE